MDAGGSYSQARESNMGSEVKPTFVSFSASLKKFAGSMSS